MHILRFQSIARVIVRIHNVLKFASRLSFCEIVKSQVNNGYLRPLPLETGIMEVGCSGQFYTLAHNSQWDRS